MSHQHTNTPKAKRAGEDDDNTLQSAEPTFRFTRLEQPPSATPELISNNTSLAKPSQVGSGEIIDKASFLAVGAAKPPPHPVLPNGSNWFPKTLRTVPAFYPLEKSTRLVEDQDAVDVANRVSACLKILSVHADYNNETATANLVTCENVEMHLSLWKTPSNSSQDGVLVELQRRKGDSIAFHRYSRSILDAAVGDVDAHQFSAELLDDMVYSKKVQRLLACELRNQENEEHENAVIAIEIAHGLLMKDRMDARQLGLESLCLLTDARKTGMLTALLTSHVVLLGSTQGIQIPGMSAESDIMMDEAPFQEIRDAVLGLVQFSRIGEDEALETGNDVDLMPDQEHMTLLHNLALAVLANALDAIEHPERFEDEPEDTKPRARINTASSADIANEFLQATEEVSSKEILKTLIGELGKAHQKPHNATLSAKCIGSLCRASEEAKRRAKELGAKMVVSTALDVGVRTHLKLETECKKVVKALEHLEED